LGIGTLPIHVYARFLLRGPLTEVRAERCALAAESALATASALPGPVPSVVLQLEERGGVLIGRDVSMLMPNGPVQFSLQVFGLGSHDVSGETRGRLALLGRRTGPRMEGAAILAEPHDRLTGPANLQLAFAREHVVQGRFVLVPSSANSCDELTKEGVAWVR
jgi:hypothetical protein